MNLWHASEATFLAGRAEVDAVDLVAVGMERRWGAGRLRLLVEPELRARFDSQRRKLDVAIREGELEDIRRESRRMIAAWKALDKAAQAAGKPATAPPCWEVTLGDGTVAAIVRDDEAASLVQHEGRRMVVYTLAEVASILTAQSQWVTAAKLTFPGATVTRIRTPADPLDDELPF